LSYTSCDTNILLRAHSSRSPFCDAARTYLVGRAEDPSFRICELVLVELYVLLRNPAVLAKPLSPEAAVQVCQQLRTNPAWGVLDYPGPTAHLMDGIWKLAARPAFARRRIFEARLAFTLLHYGVTVLATQNVDDFQGLGFARVYNPLEE